MPYVQRKFLIQTNIFYNIEYQRLIKETRIWNNM